jgi:hypothetical protein
MKYPGGHAKVKQKNRRRKFTQRNCGKTTCKKVKSFTGKHFTQKKDGGIFIMPLYYIIFKTEVCYKTFVLQQVGLYFYRSLKRDGILNI